ncbi:hypothetical protein DFJ43DRAFT_1036359 [Lentinula guzmanii]|uniref:Uncharacterized protein n=1 Tax=Lentinula guzmanii TaxID=2804957 RepID=A0AA38JUR2_9AGAR|nr:hypothetical protein DFJ43DRAFT_1036359 [Lentinula guzmanii]
MSAKQPTQKASPHQYLSSQFEQSRTDVTKYAAWFEQKYARPALQKMQSYYREHPLVSIFAAVFMLLSLLPIATYIGLCLIILISLLVSALCAVVVVFTTIALALGSILLLVVLTNLLLSIFVTFFLVAAYFSFKIASACYQDGFNAARLQFIEFYDAFFSRVQTTVDQKSSQHSTSASGEAIIHEAHEGSRSSSPDSTVIVNSSGTNDGTPNVENPSTAMKFEEEY